MSRFDEIFSKIEDKNKEKNKTVIADFDININTNENEIKEKKYTLKKKLEHNEEVVSSLDSQSLDIDNSIKEYDIKINDLETKLNDKQLEILNLSKENEIQKNKLLDKEYIIKELENKINSSNLDKEKELDLISKIELLTEDLKKESERSNLLQEEIDNKTFLLNQEISSLSQKLVQIEEEKSNFYEAKIEIEKRKSEIELEIEELKDINNDLEFALKNLQDENDLMKSAIEETEIKYKEQEKILEDTKAENKLLEEEKEVIKNELEKTKKEKNLSTKRIHIVTSFRDNIGKTSCSVKIAKDLSSTDKVLLIDFGKNNSLNLGEIFVKDSRSDNDKYFNFLDYIISNNFNLQGIEDSIFNIDHNLYIATNSLFMANEFDDNKINNIYNNLYELSKNYILVIDINSRNLSLLEKLLDLDAEKITVVENDIYTLHKTIDNMSFREDRHYKGWTVMFNKYKGDSINEGILNTKIDISGIKYFNLKENLIWEY